MPSSLARINLSVLGENIEYVISHLDQDVGVLFAAKSDAYGHGIEAVSNTAREAGVDYLGVATLDEAVKVRNANVTLPILLLSPILLDEVQTALDLGLTLQVSDLAFARLLAQSADRMGKKARIHVNVDTGMGRFGVLPGEAALLLEQLYELPSLSIEGVFSHLSVADSKDPTHQEYTRSQIERFITLLDDLKDADLLPPLRHIGNSAAVIQYPDLVISPVLNLVRIGTLFYGYPEASRPWVDAVRPVATLTTRVIALKNLAPGDCVGYGCTYQAHTAQRIAILPVGYGSGISPCLANCGEVRINEDMAPVVGKILLDHTIVDITNVKNVSVGNTVEVFGPHVPADHVAKMAGLTVCEILVPALRGAAARVYE